MQPVPWISAALARWDDSAARHRVAADPSGPPVFLVHGFLSSQGDLKRLERHLERAGRTVHGFDFACASGHSTLEALASEFRDFIVRMLPEGKLDIIGFSMGGLVARYYLQRLGGLARVRHLLTLGTPHHGTLLAVLNKRPGILQMRRGSEFLRDLGRDADTLRTIKFTSIYTALDTMIVPAASSAMPQARNIRTWALTHPGLMLEKRCLRLIASLLADEG